MADVCVRPEGASSTSDRNSSASMPLKRSIATISRWSSQSSAAVCQTWRRRKISAWRCLNWRGPG